MRHSHLSWIRSWAALALALVLLMLLLGVMGGRATAGRSAPPPQRGAPVEAPALQQEALWAQAGLNDAWYIAHGYTDAPPPSAPSPFWRPPSGERTDSGSEGSLSTPEVGDGPRLVLDPQAVFFYAYADQPKLLSATVSISNAGGGTLGWVAQLAPGGAFTPTLVPTSGLQGEGLTLLVDSAEVVWGSVGFTHTRRITVTATPTDTLDSPQILTASLYVDPHVPRLWLETNEIGFRASVRSPGVYSRMVMIRNTGGHTLTWGTEAFSQGVAPLVTPKSGVQDGLITVTVDAREYPSTTAVYTGWVVVTATWGTAALYPVLDAPQKILVRLRTGFDYAYLPYIIKQEPPPPPTEPPPEPPGSTEVRAIWVTRYDWTSAYGPEGPDDIDRIVANVAGAGFNTIFFQIRAQGDAYYQPGLEPWSARLNDAGELGRDPGWDPLARMIEQAHARGIQVHAYVNVYPAWLGTTPPLENTTPEHPFHTWSHIYTWDDWRQWKWPKDPMNLNSSYLWASPGVDGVRDHIVEVVKDIVRRYAVDGVHLDLVRYANSPYSYDPASNAGSGSDVKTPERDQWQRERVTGLVSRVYTAMREIRPAARLSAAVWFCYYADGCGHGLSSGYAEYYQDSLGWLATGVIDGIAPMLYEWQGFSTLEIWREVMLQFQNANAGRHVYPGIGGDFADFSEIDARIQAARTAGAAGHAIFSYGAIDAHGYWDEFAAGPYAQPATLAPLPWR